jgi:hypothetical protein
MMFILSIAERYVRPIFSTTINFMGWAPRLAIARLVAKWRSLLTIIVGVILGAGIGALVPLYTSAVSQVGLVQRLADSPAHDANARMRITLRLASFGYTPGNEDSKESATEALNAIATSVDQDQIRAAVADHFEVPSIEGWMSPDDVVGYVETDKMGIVTAEDDPQPLRVSNATRSGNVRASVIALQGWEDQVRVVQGELPSRAALQDGVQFNVAITTTVANEFSLEAGDQLIIDQRLNPRLDDDGSLLTDGGWRDTSLPFVVQITAVVAPNDDQSAYWMAIEGENDTPLQIVTDGSIFQWLGEFRFLADQADVVNMVTSYAPQTPLTFGWRMIFNHDELPYSRIDDGREALSGFAKELERNLGENTSGNATGINLGFSYETQLIETRQFDLERDSGILQDYAKRQAANAAPFSLLLLEVGALVLFFLIVTAALVRRGERREIAMLQSRGALESHILALRGIEAFLISVFGAIAAPFVAQQVLVLLGPSVAGTDEFPLPLTGTVFLYSFFAATFTFLALTGTLLPVLKQPLVSAGGASLRSGTVSWWQKYYVDVVIAVIGLIALYWLVTRDTPLLKTNLGDQKVDPLLVLAPAFLFLGLGSIALRFFPLIAGATAKVASRQRGLLGSLATWQLSREPIHYGRITFLLALAISTGWFATSFRATVRRSQEDQAHYRVGTDVRMFERDTSLNVDRVRDTDFYNESDDVEAASLGFRTRVSQINQSNAERSAGEVVGIDSSTFGDVALDTWRPDLGNIWIPYESDHDLGIATVGDALPTIPDRIGMWARLELGGFSFNAGQTHIVNLQRLTRRVRLGLRLQDDTGAWILVPFDQVRVEYLRRDVDDSLDRFDQPGLGSAAHVTSGWVYYEADLSNLEYEPQGTLRLVSIYWEHRSNNTGGETNIRLSLAEMSLIDANGSSSPYSILNRGNWDFQYDSGANANPRGDTPQAAQQSDNLHRDIIYVDFDQSALRTRVGINLNYPTRDALFGVVSQRLAEIDNITIDDQQNCDNQNSLPASFTILNVAGSSIQVIPCQIAEYFPTLFNEEMPFVVVDVRELMYELNRRPAAQFYANEVWLNLDDEADSIDEVNTVMNNLTGGDDSGVVRVREETFVHTFDNLGTDPLALGLLGLMFLAFLIALVLSIVGLVTYAALTAQARRSEFGVLRALGLPSSRVVWSLITEQVFVVLIAGLLGSVLGHILSIFVVPTLALGATGEGVVPPFITEIEWASIFNFWLIMAAVLLSVFAFSFILVRQLSLSRTLRMGDE